jgi:hypothetical protein
MRGMGLLPWRKSRRNPFLRRRCCRGEIRASRGYGAKRRAADLSSRRGCETQSGGERGTKGSGFRVQERTPDATIERLAVRSIAAAGLLRAGFIIRKRSRTAGTISHLAESPGHGRDGVASARQRYWREGRSVLPGRRVCRSRQSGGCGSGSMAGSAPRFANHVKR